MADPLIPLLLDFFPDTIIVEPFTGNNRYGVKTYGAPLGTGGVIRARITGKVQTVEGDDGQEHVSRVNALLAGAYGVTAQDRFTLPVRFSTDKNASTPEDQLRARQPTALSVAQVSDENGPHHERVYF